MEEGKKLFLFGRRRNSSSGSPSSSRRNSLGSSSVPPSDTPSSPRQSRGRTESPGGKYSPTLAPKSSPTSSSPSPEIDENSSPKAEHSPLQHANLIQEIEKVQFKRKHTKSSSIVERDTLRFNAFAPEAEVKELPPSRRFSESRPSESTIAKVNATKHFLSEYFWGLCAYISDRQKR